jgi:hypothetical protein
MRRRCGSTGLHDQVGHDNGRAKRRHLLQRFFAVGRFFGLKAPRRDELRQPHSGRRIVFNDQHAFGGRDVGVVRLGGHAIGFCTRGHSLIFPLEAVYHPTVNFTCSAL